MLQETVASICRRVRPQASPRLALRTSCAADEAGALATPPLFDVFQALRGRRPAVADITGARLVWTAVMISSVSMPWR